MLKVIKVFITDVFAFIKSYAPILVFIGIVVGRLISEYFIREKMKSTDSNRRKFFYNALLEKWIDYARDNGIKVVRRELKENDPVILNFENPDYPLIIINKKYNNLAGMYVFFRCNLVVALLHHKHKLLSRVINNLRISMPFALFLLVFATYRQDQALMLISNFVLVLGLTFEFFVMTIFSIMRYVEKEADEDIINIMPDSDRMSLEFPYIYKYPIIKYLSLILLRRSLIELIVYGGLFSKILSIIIFLGMFFLKDLQVIFINVKSRVRAKSAEMN